MEDSKYTKPVTTMLPDIKQLEVMLQQKEVTTDSGLTIKSYWVKEQKGEPFVVQVLGSDAEIEAGGTYLVMLRERSQTRISDNRTFVELQVAGAQKV
jgi:hypothetical protein